MRTLPIGNTKEKMLSRFAQGDSKGMFDVWFNAQDWHRFIDKCGLLLHPKHHKVTLFSEYVDNPWKNNTTLHIGYDWLKDEFEIYTIPECEFEGPFPEAQHVNPWEFPGQRVLENFAEITNYDATEEEK